MTRRNPQLNDVVLIPCPHCNKGIVWERPEHNCKMTVPYTSYISKELRVRITWKRHTGWNLFWHPEDEPVDRLVFVQVVNWINDKSVGFKPIVPEEDK